MMLSPSCWARQQQQFMSVFFQCLDTCENTGNAVAAAAPVDLLLLLPLLRRVFRQHSAEAFSKPSVP
jgi:hypothetical protein